MQQYETQRPDQRIKDLNDTDAGTEDQLRSSQMMKSTDFGNTMYKFNQWKCIGCGNPECKHNNLSPERTIAQR